MHFIGDFNATSTNIKTKGTLASALGWNVLQTFLFHFQKMHEPFIKEVCKQNNLILVNFYRFADLGNVTFNGKVEGRSFKLDKISTKINGNFTSLSFKDYTYSNLNI